MCSSLYPLCSSLHEETSIDCVKDSKLKVVNNQHYNFQVKIVQVTILLQTKMLFPRPLLPRSLPQSPRYLNTALKVFIVIHLAPRVTSQVEALSYSQQHSMVCWEKNTESLPSGMSKVHQCSGVLYVISHPWHLLDRWLGEGFVGNKKISFRSICRDIR